MGLQTVPSADVAGIDEDGNPLVAGVSSAGDVVTALMVPDSADPTVGAMSVVQVGNSVAAGYGSLAIVGAATAVPISADIPCAAMSVINDDGAAPNGNLNTVFWGFDASVDNTSGFPIRPGVNLDISVNNVNLVYFFSLGNVDLRWAAIL